MSPLHGILKSRNSQVTGVSHVKSSPYFVNKGMATFQTSLPPSVSEYMTITPKLSSTFQGSETNIFKRIPLK